MLLQFIPQVFTFVLMKFVVLLCSIYLLGISLFPCNDSAAKDITLTSVQQLTANSSQHAVQDECSPFCTCACCNVSFSLHHLLAGVEAPRPAVLSAEKIRLRDFNFVSGYSGNIWQPPKIHS